MKETTRSPLQALYNNHPQAFFLIDTVMHQASIKDWEAITEKVEVVDEGRLDRAIRWQIRRADQERLQDREKGNQEFAARYPRNHKFRFYGYKQVKAAPAPTSFICRKCGYVTSLKDKIEKNKLARNDLICPNCKSALKQIVHVFGHPPCGEIAEITPRNCPECKQPYRLILDNIAFGRSTWRCPNGDEERRLAMTCPACAARGLQGEEAGMTPYAAGVAVKSVSIAMVDISTDVDWEDVARRRLEVKQESLRQLILEHYQADPMVYEAIKQRLDSNEATRRQMYEQFLETRPELRNKQDALKDAIGREPSPIVQRLLAEYHGTELAADKSPDDPLDSHLRQLILGRFHLTPRYVANLPILQIVYGYQVGTNNLQGAKVLTFDRGRESVALTHRMETEAGLFDLSPAAVAAWVSRKLGVAISELSLHKMLIRQDAGGGAGGQEEEVYQLVETLLHTLAHLMIRQSELFTGLSRESLSEMIFPPALAFAIICEDGSELGALRSAFASYRLWDWLNRSLFASKECAHDPVCVEGRITGSAACHACLFIAERRCNGYWNQQLNRRLVSDVRSNDGFWDG
ncbi:MAG: hypothetical protein KJ077_07600 [Anaerolineae bacterium]|nr:hypothetical protein [Anaerolineae bacterium]